MQNKFIFLLILVCAIPYSILPTLKSIAAAKWPTIKAQLVNYGIVEEQDIAGDGSWHYPNIEYKYTINGKEYTSNSIAIGFWLANIKFFATRLIKKQTSQKVVSVAYNPKNHAESTLATGLQLFHVAQIALVVLTAYFLCF